MIDLRDSLNPSPQNWIDISDPVHCDWEFIECNSQKQVISINLANKNLNGYFQTVLVI